MEQNYSKQFNVGNNGLDANMYTPIQIRICWCRNHTDFGLETEILCVKCTIIEMDRYEAFIAHECSSMPMKL